MLVSIYMPQLSQIKLDLSVFFKILLILELNVSN